MSIVKSIEVAVLKGVEALYGEAVPAKQINISTTRKEFTGDYTVVCFPFTRVAKKKRTLRIQQMR